MAELTISHPFSCAFNNGIKWYYFSPSSHKRSFFFLLDITDFLCPLDIHPYNLQQCVNSAESKILKLVIHYPPKKNEMGSQSSSKLIFVDMKITSFVLLLLSSHMFNILLIILVYRLILRIHKINLLSYSTCQQFFASCWLINHWTSHSVSTRSHHYRSNNLLFKTTSGSHSWVFCCSSFRCTY